MKKALCLLFCLFTVLPLLFSCHGARGIEPFVMPESFDESKTYEITFWAKNDTNLFQKNIYSKAISDFEALYPNIKISVSWYNDYAKIYNDVITNIPTLTTPNVCITYPDHIATYMTGKNVIAPIGEMMNDPRYGLGGSALKYDAPTKDEVIPQFLNEGIIQGEQYALPFMRSTEACYVNKDMVEAMGYTLPETLTWDFVWEVSEKAMEKNEDGTFKANGQKVMIPFIYKSTDNMMIQMLRQKNAPYADEDGTIRIFGDTTRELLYTISEHAKTKAFSTFKISSYPGNFLNAGQCIFAIDSTAGATWMGSKAPHLDISEDKLIPFETAVMTIPQFDPGHPQMISQGPSVCVFNKKDPDEVLASYLFAQYLLTNEVQIAYSQTEGYVPVTSKAQNAPEYVDYLSRAGEDNDSYYDVKINAAKVLLANTGNTFVTPVFNGSASLREAAGNLIEKTTTSTNRGEKIDDAFFSGLYDEIYSLNHLDQRGGSIAKKEFGALPSTAVWLIVLLAAAWVLIGLYYLRGLLKKEKTEKALTFFQIVV